MYSRRTMLLQATERVTFSPGAAPRLGLRLRRMSVLLPAFGFLILAVWTPADDGFTICPFARATGHACPGCGMTRAVSAVLHGRFADAWAYHPLVGPFLVELVVAWAWWAGVRAGRLRPPSVRLVNWVLAVNAVVFLAVWVWRWNAGTLPPV